MTISIDITLYFIPEHKCKAANKQNNHLQQILLDIRFASFLDILHTKL